MSKIAKLLQLFGEGEVCEIGPIVVWVNKLSPFTQAQCDHEGRVARARKMLEIREVGSDEYAIFRSQLNEASRQSLITGYLNAKGDETLARVLREIRSDEDWRERITVVEHSPEHLDGLPQDHPEMQLVARTLEAYQNEVIKRVTEANEDFRKELEDLSDGLLRERFEEHYVDNQGMRAFTATRQRYEIFYAARECRGIKDAEGAWDHSSCNHMTQLLDDVKDVIDLPGAVTTKILDTLMRITVPNDLARFTDGPTSSSVSSGPSSSAEGSTASGPGEAPAAPAPIS